MSDTTYKPYNHSQIEPKWQKVWEGKKLYQAEDFSKKPKRYILVEFPYPSGEGLHVGHVRSYSALDAYSRYLRMKGFNVLYPMGWDAFGLPTENFALKTGIHPQIATNNNVANFKRQMKTLGLSFDWSREVNTTDSGYYKWTQWIFLQFLKKGLAYQSSVPVNWCPKCKSNLADEEVLPDGTHERCGAQTERKMQKQWMLAITKYAERLLEDLKLVDYSPRIAQQQINWIGKRLGTKIKFKIKNPPFAYGFGGAQQKSKIREIKVFTTRADTLFGAVALVVAPEHPLINEILQGSFGIETDKMKTLQEYVKQSQTKSEIERAELAREKTGVFTGLYAVNPVNNEEMPIWVADYVVGWYGHGAVMLVPAHDERDFEFAKKYNLAIKEVVTSHSGTSMSDKAYTNYGILVNSGIHDGLTSEEAVKRITADLEKEGRGEKSVAYHLRDWIFSRQHYWGEPIPVIHCPKCGVVPVPKDQLPVELPQVEHYEPTETGESPLANLSEWVNVTCPSCGGPAKRETDTMPNWAGSSWYFLRYADPKNDKKFADFEKMEYWLMIDLYNGGMEHTTLHLLYSRFWHKFMYDLKLVPTPEPYAKRRSHGMVLAFDGKKMSKSLGNVVNPDDVVKEYGADTMRLYEMFMGPFSEAIAWNPRGVAGVYRFLAKIYILFGETKNQTTSLDNSKINTALTKLIKKTENDIEAMKYNTIISSMMEFLNEISKDKETLTVDIWDKFLRILAPFAPHLAEELWQEIEKSKVTRRFGGQKSKIQRAEVSVHQQTWPLYDPKLLVEETAVIVIQVNGKVRDKITLSVKAGEQQEMVLKRAGESEKTQKYLNGRDFQTFFVPGRLINFVTD